MTSAPPQVLLAWIGNADLAGAGLSAPGRATPSTLAGASPPKPGPIAAALRAERFTEVVLLVSWRGDVGARYAKWLREHTNAAVHVRASEIVTPTDYEAIYRQANAAAKEALDRRGPEAKLTFHLSPGTPAMAAVWIILGKTRFDAKLIHSSLEQGVTEAVVPFELTADFLPDLMRARDEAIARQLEGRIDPSFQDIVHASAAMRAVLGRAQIVALHPFPVLLEGETGTGKELFARAIHGASPRRSKPFVTVNCGAIPESLIEGEFFGWKKGAFTGAQSDREGYFQQADRGTLFLDEIGELSPAVQVRLLRALQESEVRRLGDERVIKVDVRVIAATHRNLLADVTAGRFREDLFYRLAVLSLRIPALRDRGNDSLVLADHMVARLGQGAQDGVTKKLTLGARKVIQRHRWPGNVRELQATMHRAWVWTAGPTLDAKDLEESLLAGVVPDVGAVLGQPLGDGFDLRKVISQVARHYLERGLAEADGNKSRAAELVGLPSYQTLSNWLAKYKIKG